MKNAFRLTIVIMLCLLTFSVEAQTKADKSLIKQKRFERLLKRDNVILLDVRTAQEFVSTHLYNAINIDVKHPNFLNQIQGLDTTKTYLLYCRSGKRSQTALETMEKHGIKKVFHLKGGIQAWQGSKK